jgi:hypothetical protein
VLLAAERLNYSREKSATQGEAQVAAQGATTSEKGSGADQSQRTDLRTDDWSAYVSKTPGAAQLKEAWESNTPIGFNKSYRSFVAWYGIKKSELGRHFSVEEAIGFITGGSQESAQQEDAIQEGLDESTPTEEGETQTKPDEPEQKVELQPISLDELKSALERLASGSAGDIMVPSVDSAGNITEGKGLDKSTASRRVSRMVRQIGGYDKAVESISSDFAGKFYSDLKVIQSDYVAKGQQEYFVKKRSEFITGLAYKYLAEAWAQTGERQGAKKRRVDRQNRRVQNRGLRRAAK